MRVFCVLSEIGQEIKRSQQLIVQYKEELKKSRVIRRQRQEYDAMAKVQCSVVVWRGFITGHMTIR